MTLGGGYDAVRAAVDADGSDYSRVEVNQRALIDKILARYASAGAVYRELLQNSNDAEATTAEILITTQETSNASIAVTQVVYRNNGMPFRPQDWSRLKKIAEGNPDVSKVGAFGVGAYTMFSICEEPLVISGSEALAFVWKGDALWTKTAPNHSSSVSDEWTTFVLPSRDPYPLPDLVEFGSFLCASLTFTQCLRLIRVKVDGKERLVIKKTQVQAPTVVKPPKASSFWKNDGAITASPKGFFTLGRSDGSILESINEVTVTLDGESSSVRARYVSGTAKTKIPTDVARRMLRVTKKKPPPQVHIQVFINAAANDQDNSQNDSGASRITQSFSPQMGSGRVFIGFRTSQTTGLAAHLAAPLIPTVEREAIDFQDAALRQYNTELLELAGILMRLTLEQAMSVVGEEWEQNAAHRQELEAKLAQEETPTKKSETAVTTKKPEDQISNNSSSSIATFAKFMAKGVKKKIVGVLQSVDALVDDGSAELLHPRDPRPLSPEEKHAIVLMRSFCPQQSTPDTLVGMSLASGFSACMPNTSPPVLTRSGVVRGSDARLPNHGMEAFVQQHVVRRVLYENAKEYHEVIARCRRLVLHDLSALLPTLVLEEAQVVRLLRWWTKYSRVEPHVVNLGSSLKDKIRYFSSEKPKTTDDVTDVIHLKNFLFYSEPKSLPEGLPMPDTVLPKTIQESVGSRTLEDISLKLWFSPLSMEIWAEFICRHACMTAAQPEDENLRILVLSTLAKEYSRKPRTERDMFASFLNSLLADKKCIPFDSQEATKYAAECPGYLYLSSAELKAFDGIGSFNKVSHRLKDSGVSDEFLLSLGVRKSVSIDFLFTNLDTLNWSDDPKPLVEYLKSASLTNADLEKLKTTQYLPAENDISRTFAPSELYLPDASLRVFPFVKLLQWPSDELLTTKTPNGKFLQKLGCKVYPALHDLLMYVTNDVTDKELRIQCLDYVCQHLGPNGAYVNDYEPSRFKPLSNAKELRSLRFLPAVRRDPLMPKGEVCVLQSPNTCYANPACLIMGFPVLSPEAEKRSGGLYATRFAVPDEPLPIEILKQLLDLVMAAKNRLLETSGNNRKELCTRVCTTFPEIFKYLSTRSTDFGEASITKLKSQAFIPRKVSDSAIAWYRPTDVYFKNSESEDDSLTERLFHVIEFSPFLAAAGVKTEATTEDLFRLMIASPDEVLRTLGSEAKYRSLLRRVAANPPFKRVTPEIRESPFLLAYKVQEDMSSGNDQPKEKATYLLAKAHDIHIIDNSFFGRMFPVLRAPHESDLEDFYVELGSAYISKGVTKNFEVLGRQREKTELTRQLAGRITERRPLLVSPSVTSRPLVPNASTVLEEKKLQIIEADSLKAVYSLGKSVRNQRITCCAKSAGGRKNGLYITDEFDWFDVGYAIGGLILQRCQLEDAFFIGSLLEAPLDQLRARGFPVDRILRPTEPVVEAVKEPGPTVAAMPPAGTPPVKTPHAKRDDPDIGGMSKDGFVTILLQMYPDVSEEFIRSRLGNEPTLEDVRSLAEEMSSGDYPKNAAAAAHSSNSEKLPPIKSKKDRNHSADGNSGALNDHKRKFGKRLSRAFGGRRTPHSSGNTPPRVKYTEDNKPSFASDTENVVAPAADEATHKGMEEMLRKTVGASAKVNAKGVSSGETVNMPIPDSLNRNPNGCEVMPSQDLKPFTGPYRTGKSHNGIRVFASRKHTASDDFLGENFHAVDTFADVIKELCSVYALDLSTVAIYHEPVGATIAFNSNRSLHFNVRFFYALHYSLSKHDSAQCYSYWFTVMAHELAHHLASGHNKEHGFYTESYVTMYLPKLAELLQGLENRGPSVS